MRKIKDCDSAYLNVPCGVCSECVAKRQMFLVQRVRAMSLDYYLFFCTLTYNNESLPKIITSQGKTIQYADIADVQKMFKRIRKLNPFDRQMSYLFVSERGKERGRPHFHGLIFIKKNPSDDELITAQFETSLKRLLFKEWRRNYGSTRSPIWKPLFTYHTKYVAGKIYKNFDCHYVVPHSTENGPDDVAFYVSKYILKPSFKEERLQQALRLNLPEDEYEEIWQKVRSKCFFSKHFGASSDKQISYVKSCISKSVDDPSGLKFYTQNGDPQPLARYYMKYVGLDEGLKSAVAKGSPLSIDDRSLSEKDRSISKGSFIKEKVSQRDISELFPD